MSELKETKKLIRTNLAEFAWYPHAQKEVQDGLNKIIDHIGQMGAIFCDAFEVLYIYHSTKNSITTQSKNELYGVKLTHKEYADYCPVVRALFDFQDWQKPNEADILVCLHIYEKLNLLKQLGRDWSSLDPAIKELNNPAE